MVDSNEEELSELREETERTDRIRDDDRPTSAIEHRVAESEVEVESNEEQIVLSFATDTGRSATVTFEGRARDQIDQLLE
jgi:hypothetical protein